MGYDKRYYLFTTRKARRKGSKEVNKAFKKANEVFKQEKGT
jgi:hypothetical protein